MSVKYSVADISKQCTEPFRKVGFNVTRLETRPAPLSLGYELLVDYEASPSDIKVQELFKELNKYFNDVSPVSSLKVPWFPRQLKDIDFIANETLDAGKDLHADHPGFHDVVYRERRNTFDTLARNYKYGQPIPSPGYTLDEIKTWRTVYERVFPLWEKYACKEHLDLILDLEKSCGFRKTIPQLSDVSAFLQDRTGFTLRPVPGMLSGRNFLGALAFRVFLSTQYLRHHSRPFYTPEPDVCHELLGHAALFANPGFADFSQALGLASIGATDEQITKLSRCYWYSVEVGLCQQNGQRKVYGASLLSSYGELEWAMSDKPKVRKWDPFKAGEIDFPITDYQPTYFCAESFEDAKNKMKEFALSLHRPFHVRYNPKTQSLEVDRNIEFDSDTIPKRETEMEKRIANTSN